MANIRLKCKMCDRQKNDIELIKVDDTIENIRQARIIRKEDKFSKAGRFNLKNFVHFKSKTSKVKEDHQNSKYLEALTTSLNLVNKKLEKFKELDSKDETQKLICEVYSRAYRLNRANDEGEIKKLIEQNSPTALDEKIQLCEKKIEKYTNLKNTFLEKRTNAENDIQKFKNNTSSYVIKTAKDVLGDVRTYQEIMRDVKTLIIKLSEPRQLANFLDKKDKNTATITFIKKLPETLQKNLDSLDEKFFQKLKEANETFSKCVHIRKSQ